MTDDVHSLSGAYALHALPADEHAAFEQHLEECAPCRSEVQEFRAVGAELAGLVAEPLPSGLRAKVLGATAGGSAAATVQWATRELLGAGSRQEVADVLLTAVQRLGGRVVRADRAEDDAIPLDVGLGSDAPLLAAAEPGSQERRDLERHLPQLVEDARQAWETVRRTERGTDRAARSGETGQRER